MDTLGMTAYQSSILPKGKLRALAVFLGPHAIRVAVIGGKNQNIVCGQCVLADDDVGLVIERLDEGDELGRAGLLGQLELARIAVG